MSGSTPIRLYGTVTDSIVDGPGLRHSVFVQGCSHSCPGCHNPESQPAEGGTLSTVDAVMEEIEANKLVHDVTLTGGEPFEQARACSELARRLKEKGYGVWAYTGYLYDDLIACADADQMALLENVDVLVDGPFVESKKSLTLDWRGSANQRIIDMQATREADQVVEWKKQEFKLEKPDNW